MYTLYYLNKNYQIGTIKVSTLDEPIRIPEDLVFSNLRKGINFIKEPHKCIAFTDTERLVMSSEFTDVQLLKESDFRKQNTYLTALCLIDELVFIEFYGRVGVVDCMNGFKTVLAESTDLIYKSTDVVEIGSVLYYGNKTPIKNQLVLDFGGSSELFTTDDNGVVILVENSNEVHCKSKVLTITSATETRIFVKDVPQDLINRIYSCSSDIGLNMHIVSNDGVERVYHMSYLLFNWNQGNLYFDVIEPNEIVKVWFTDQTGDLEDSNIFVVPH